MHENGFFSELVEVTKDGLFSMVRVVANEQGKGETVRRQPVYPTPFIDVSSLGFE